MPYLVLNAQRNFFSNTYRYLNHLEIVVKCVAWHGTNAQIGSKRRKGQAIAGRNLEGALAFACHSEVL